MPTSKGFHREREEGDAYTRACMESRRHLTVVRMFERCCMIHCATVYEGDLEWRNNGDVEC